MSRVKKPSDLAYVQEQILATATQFRDQLVAPERLEAVKKHLRYSFSLSMDSNANIASVVSRYVALRRTPETINNLYALYAGLTPEDIRRTARKFFIDNGRTIVTLTGGAR